MAFRNLMEDIVTAVVDRVLFKEDKKILEYEPYKQDIITYVLNRMPPKYYTSERGILHGKLDNEFTVQQKVDLLFSTYEALKIIQNRRGTEIPEKTVEVESQIFCLPHMIGEVFEETTFSVVPGVKVQLMHNGKPAKMKDKTWKNPYKTSIATEGYYHFWPDLDNKEDKDKGEVTFEIVFKHPDLEEKSVEINLKVLDTINVYKSHIMPITLLNKKEGVNISSIT